MTRQHRCQWKRHRAWFAAFAAGALIGLVAALHGHGGAGITTTAIDEDGRDVVRTGMPQVALPRTRSADADHWNGPGGRHDTPAARRDDNSRADLVWPTLDRAPTLLSDEILVI